MKWYFGKSEILTPTGIHSLKHVHEKAEESPTNIGQNTFFRLFKSISSESNKKFAVVLRWIMFTELFYFLFKQTSTESDYKAHDRK